MLLAPLGCDVADIYGGEVGVSGWTTAFVWSRPFAKWYGGDAGEKLPVKRGRFGGFSDIWERDSGLGKGGAGVDAVGGGGRRCRWRLKSGSKSG